MYSLLRRRADELLRFVTSCGRGDAQETLHTQSNRSGLWAAPRIPSPSLDRNHNNPTLSTRTREAGRRGAVAQALGLARIAVTLERRTLASTARRSTDGSPTASQQRDIRGR